MLRVRYVCFTGKKERVDGGSIEGRLQVNQPARPGESGVRHFRDPGRVSLSAPVILCNTHTQTSNRAMKA